MNYIAVDDEPFALEDLEEALREAVPEATLTVFATPSKALAYAKTNQIDVAFLDVEMGSISGLVLAKQLKDIQPQLHIIFVTSYEQYAVGAFAVHATGYLIKPAKVEDIHRELTFLYGERLHKAIRMQTFGGFAVFVNGKAITITRAKSRELLAYLVSRRGAAISTAQACAILWEDEPYDRKQLKYFQTVLFDLRADLRAAGIEHILVRSRNSLALDTSQFDCDSYQFADGDVRSVNEYCSGYLSDYSWAEFLIGVPEH